ncbi:unnamed protein product [Lathyrus sativus]|nr:unnamed protein product [Lathyrus sativus]
MYIVLRGTKPKVDYRKLFFGNLASPRAIFTLWMACQNRLLTKDRMMKHGMSTDEVSVLCNLQESCHHLFFECEATKGVWKQAITWIGVDHNPGGWKSELVWITQQTLGKGSRTKLLKMAIAETVY